MEPTRNVDYYLSTDSELHQPKPESSQVDLKRPKKEKKKPSKRNTKKKPIESTDSESTDSPVGSDEEHSKKIKKVKKTVRRASKKIPPKLLQQIFNEKLAATPRSVVVTFGFE